MRGFWIAGIVSTFMLGACTTGPMPDGESVSTSVPISEESAFAADFGMLADLVGTANQVRQTQSAASRLIIPNGTGIWAVRFWSIDTCWRMALMAV